MTSINISGSVGNGTETASFWLLPLIVVIVLFLVTQVYLNFRLLQKNSRAPEVNKNEEVPNEKK